MDAVLDDVHRAEHDESKVGGPHSLGHEWPIAGTL
jgi:hypothetical protein